MAGNEDGKGQHRAAVARFRFQHRLTAESAYAALLRQNRRALHSAAADAILARVAPGRADENPLLRAAVQHLAVAARWHEAHEHCCYVAATVANSGGQAVEVNGMLQQAAEYWDAARAAAPGLPLASAHLAFAQGTMWRTEGRLLEAHQLLEAGARQAADQGDAALESMLRNGLGLLAWQQDRLDDASADFSAALALAHAAGEARLELPARYNLARLRYAAVDHAGAEAEARQALALARQMGSQRGEAFVLNLLGLCAGALGRRAEMRQLQEESLRLSLAVGERVNAATVRANLGNEAMDDGDLETASGWLAAALADAREVSQPQQLFFALTRAGECARRRGALPEAARLLDEAWQLAQAKGVGRHLHALFTAQGHLAIDKGDSQAGREWLRQLETYSAEHPGWEEQAVQEGITLLRDRLAKLGAPTPGDALYLPSAEQR